VTLEQVTASDELNGLPTWKVSVLWKKFYTVQTDGDIAGSVTIARRGELAQEYRTAVATDSDAQSVYPNARELHRTTALVSESDAQAEASRLLSLFKIQRRTYTTTVRWEAELATTLDIGQVVSVAFPRFGLQAGKLLLITGLTLDLRSKRAELSLWG
jgi:prophage tail gpP-like protein